MKTAEVAESRANGLIKGIDGVLRDRQTEEFLHLGPSPLNPANWAGGVVALSTIVGYVSTEVSDAFSTPSKRAAVMAQLPGIFLLSAIGLLLMVRGRRWSRRMFNRVTHNQTGAGRWIAGFFVSFGSVIIPFAGFTLSIVAIDHSGIVGPRSDELLLSFVPAVFFFLLSGWLAIRMFPVHETRDLPFALDPGCRRAGRLYGALLGLATGALFFLERISVTFEWSEAAHNALLFPVMVVAGLLMIRMSALILTHSRARCDETGDETYRARLARYVSRGVLVFAVVTPVLAAIGYFKAAQALMLPSLLSLMMIAILLVLQRLAVEIYVLLSKKEEVATESIIPVLTGAALILISLPLLALIWGARKADLAEFWGRISEGADIGGMRISPSVLLTFVIVFMIGYTLTRLLQGTLRNTVLPKTRLDAGGRNAVVSGLGYVGIFLAAVAAITSAGIDLSSIAIVAGALSVGIGFGLQTIVSNFVSGIILLIERPISEGGLDRSGGHAWLCA